MAITTEQARAQNLAMSQAALELARGIIIEATGDEALSNIVCSESVGSQAFFERIAARFGQEFNI